MYISRTLESFVASSRFPVLMLSGARQVGKTTFLRHLSEPARTYVTLDDPLVQSLAKEGPCPVQCSVTRRPCSSTKSNTRQELLPHIKIAVDRDRSPSQFWLTGSQQFHLMKGVSESLAGRVGIVQLFGLSRRERIGRDASPFLPVSDAIHNRLQTGNLLGLQELYKLIWRGDFPAIALDDQMDWNLFYSSYLQTYLQRAIRDLARVGDELSFLRFLRAAAARTAQMLNFSDLARDADVAPNTAKTWLSILQASGIIYLLEPYYTNLTKRLVRSPKLYFLDTGLCAYLTEWSSPETLEAGAMSGPILESWIVSELLKSYRHNGHMPPFYYYRDRDGKEIDLLILRDGAIYPLEMKKPLPPTKTTSNISAY